MTVALYENTMYLKNELEMYGHRVVLCNGYTGPIDAVLYKNMPISGIVLENSNFSGASGVLMIDCTNRTAGQINNYLKYRTFSPIF